ncbi:MAG: RdgB/HAM1 family non-canonical purine NTP pyrophosphatase [Candidatus Eisenbacteria bacterium]|nr:RdgB/HAM1 family non-canonical purine NTP pyrophosphatase [Candidatus Eisenbacteria bacterium]
MDLLLATRNRDKVEEIRSILRGLPLRLRTVDEFPGLPEVDEDRDTLKGNAEKKALVLAQRSGKAALADDTGLFVPALGGAPGVFSSRYAGEDASYEENRRKLIHEMRSVPDDERGAYFLCVAAVATPEGVVGTAEGRVDGSILRADRGEGGFGYDPVFYFPPLRRTFGEIGPEEKNRISHRAAAMRAVRPVIERLLDPL